MVQANSPTWGPCAAARDAGLVAGQCYGGYHNAAHAGAGAWHPRWGFGLPVLAGLAQRGGRGPSRSGMRALKFERFGGPEVLQVVEVFDPDGDGQAVVRVAAASVNPSDVKNVAGAMEGTVLPRVPGRDFAPSDRARRRQVIGHNSRGWSSVSPLRHQSEKSGTAR
jgi:hypothetical protein